MIEPGETNSVKVQIYDRDYALLTDGDPEFLRTLCADLDKRMRDIAEATGSADTLNLAVLAALSIADEAHRAKEEAIKLDEAISKRSMACISMLTRIFHRDSS